MQSKKLLIIDGHNFLFRAFSVPFKFHSKNGTPLHTTTTFLSIVRKSLSAAEFTDISVVFDSEHKTGNHALSEDYKANRQYDYGEEDSPFIHLPYIKKSLDFLKIKYFEKKGHEADDVIASIAKKYLEENPKSKVVIASNDSDFFQLLSKDTILLRGNNIFTKEDLFEILKIKPSQYVLFKSLTGDTADNIKGVAGIGKVRAAKIINKEIKFDLSEYKKLLDLNKKLIGLNQNLKVYTNQKVLELNKKIFEMKNPEIFQKLGF